MSARVDALYRQCGDVVAVTNDVGSGGIPLDRRDRLGRERTGRLYVPLAQEAAVRLVRGIPTVIKGQLPQENPAGLLGDPPGSYQILYAYGSTRGL